MDCKMIKIAGVWIEFDTLVDRIRAWGPWITEERSETEYAIWRAVSFEPDLDGYGYACRMEKQGFPADSALVRLFDEIPEALDDNGFFIEASGWARKLEGAAK